LEIKAVIFDLGGTLIEYAGPYASWPDLETPGFQAAYDLLTENGVDLPEFEVLRNAGFARLPQRWQQATLGVQNLRVVDLLREVLAQFSINGLAAAWLNDAGEAYQTAICGQAHAIESGQAVLEGVKAAGFKIGLLSNTMFTGKAHQNDLRRFGLIDYFDTMLFSADVGMWKPTAVPFQQVAADLGVEPTTCVYIGDDPASDVVGGQRAGMRVIHIDSSQRFATPAGVLADAKVGSVGEVTAVLQSWMNREP
jgi:putative hydrolase of the HAD superfamily